MSKSDPAETISVRTQRLPDGTTSVAVYDVEQKISHLRIVPFVLQIGKAHVAMEGIAGVWTHPDRRRQGHAARMMRAAVETMQAGNSCLSMLYGIPDFYPQFGYATAGPEHLIRLSGRSSEFALPEGWSVRSFVPEDLPAIRTIYDRMISPRNTVGPAIREEDGKVWSQLAGTLPIGQEGAVEQEECRVLLAPKGEVAGYLWYSETFWYPRSLMRAYESLNPLVFAEIGVTDREGAIAALSVCRAWAEEKTGEGTERKPRTPLIAAPPDSLIATMARFQSAELIQGYRRCGASMARTLSATRLLQSLQPELERRWQKARLDFRGDLILVVEDERIRLTFFDSHILVVPMASEANDPVVNARTSLSAEIPQTALARLSLGAFSPVEILREVPRKNEAAAEDALEILCHLFPERNPHMSLPDRY